jgi:predicted DCC family thiol-disulfide oxidoreductase YuxK
MKPIVLFDGTCNFCSDSVKFIIQRDSNALFRFASLQSQIGQALLEKYNVPPAIDSLVLIENGQAFVKSTAALKIARSLDGGWKYSFLLIVIPRPVRNVTYDYFAKHRYRWFGRAESCMLPTEELKSRFLE